MINLSVEDEGSNLTIDTDHRSLFFTYAVGLDLRSRQTQIIFRYKLPLRELSYQNLIDRLEENEK